MDDEKNNAIKEAKQNLRNEIRRLKRIADPTVKLQESANVFSQIERLERFKSAKTILAYWSMPDEVFTHDFVLKWHKEKRFILPLVVGDVLELRVFSGMESMVVGPAFGILEPQKGLKFEYQPIDFAVIPGVAFDLKGNRLGRGKGYYDKLLSIVPTFKAGVALTFQVVHSVPVGEFDIPLDLVVYPQKKL